MKPKFLNFKAKDIMSKEPYGKACCSVDTTEIPVYWAGKFTLIGVDSAQQIWFIL